MHSRLRYASIANDTQSSSTVLHFAFVVCFPNAYVHAYTHASYICITECSNSALSNPSCINVVPRAFVFASGKLGGIRGEGREQGEMGQGLELGAWNSVHG